jgi:hypothetical protein
MKVLLYVFLIIIVLSNSCTNPFNVRNPEKPAENSGSDFYEQPTTYETVLSNLRYAVIQKSLTNYKKCFIDAANLNDYTYRFAPDSRIDKELFDNWTLEDEFDYFEKMTADNDIKSINLNDFGLDEEDFTPITNFRDSVQTDIFNYELTISFSDTILRFTGQAKMKLMKNDNSLWSIYYWEDRADSDNSPNSWSSLKLLY